MSEQKHMTVNKWFWVWQFEEEEQWLAEMAAQGWALCRVGYATYHFERCAPGEYTVRLEMLNGWPNSADGQAYIQQKQAGGAEYVGSMVRWVYFRKKGEFDLMPNADARLRHIDRMQPLLWVVTLLLGINWLNQLTLLFRFEDAAGIALGLMLLISVLLCLFAGGIRQLNELQQRYRYEQQHGEAPPTRIIRKWIWVWQFEEEDIWLNRMAADGWVLDAVGFCRYTFRRCAPGEYTVKLQLMENLADRSYIDFVESTGAEYIGRMAKWIYFRKPTAEGPFELFSDVDSRIRQLDKILAMLTGVGVLALGATGLNLRFGLQGSLPNLQMAVLCLSGAGLLGYCIHRIRQKRSRLTAERALHE